METFDWKFPNYLELTEKFKLDRPENEDLKFEIELMYERYNSLYSAMRSMTPEKIKFYEKLDYIIRDKYLDDIMRLCREYTQEQEVKLDLFKNEPNTHAVVQSLFNIYMNQCAERFKRDIKDIFKEK